MPLTIVLPARLPEALAEPAAAPLSLPRLERLLSSATITAGIALESWLCEALGVVVGRDTPVAPLRLSAENEDAATAARDGYWLCADPVTASIGLDSVHIGSVVDDLSGNEAGALVRSLGEFFAADGLRFVAPSPSRWYVRSDSDQDLSTVPVEQVLGRSMLRHLPSGPDAPAWRTRINETQMLLHEHPVNVARAGRGQAPVASCWWWGGGRWPRFGRARFDTVVGAPEWVRAACGENGVAIGTGAPHDVLSSKADAGNTLLFVDAPEAGSAYTQWQTLDERWVEAMLEASRKFDGRPWTIVIPWTAGTLQIDVGAPKRESGWRRLLGRREAPPAAIGAALQAFIQ